MTRPLHPGAGRTPRRRRVLWAAALGALCTCRQNDRQVPTADSTAAIAATSVAMGPPGPTHASGQAVSPVPPRCPAGMVYLPAGTFTMGSSAAEGEADEHPQRRLAVAAFCLGRTEVTVAEYRRCVREEQRGERCGAPGAAIRDNCNAGWGSREQHPINCIGWQQARTYCRWAGGRLPTEVEWEYAARGSGGRRYPWGGAPPSPELLNVCGGECAAVHRDWPPMYPGGDGFPKTAPVGSFPRGRSPFGLLDMAGNVWEWTADEHLPYGELPAAAVRGPEWVGRRGKRVVRGGGWFHHDPARVRSANRNSYVPTERNGHVGVRCAAAPGLD